MAGIFGFHNFGSTSTSCYTMSTSSLIDSMAVCVLTATSATKSFEFDLKAGG